jgi:hypothetical protein
MGVVQRRADGTHRPPTLGRRVFAHIALSDIVTLGWRAKR